MGNAPRGRSHSLIPVSHLPPTLLPPGGSIFLAPPLNAGGTTHVQNYEEALFTEYVVPDNAGNTVTYTSASVAKINVP